MWNREVPGACKNIMQSVLWRYCDHHAWRGMSLHTTLVPSSRMSTRTARPSVWKVGLMGAGVTAPTVLRELFTSAKVYISTSGMIQLCLSLESCNTH
jgi:hypothetical protein